MSLVKCYDCGRKTDPVVSARIEVPTGRSSRTSGHDGGGHAFILTSVEYERAYLCPRCESECVGMQRTARQRSVGIVLISLGCLVWASVFFVLPVLVLVWYVQK
jgi:hypothetical protein